jgi:hypothetical protein
MGLRPVPFEASLACVRAAGRPPIWPLGLALSAARGGLAAAGCGHRLASAYLGGLAGFPRIGGSLPAMLHATGPQPLALRGVFPPCQGGRVGAEGSTPPPAVREARQDARLGAPARAPAPPPTPPRAARIFTLRPLEKIRGVRKLYPTTCSLVFRLRKSIVLAG